jgi:hypothetical protein
MDCSAESNRAVHDFIRTFEYQKFLAGSKGYHGIRGNFNMLDQVRVEDQRDAIETSNLNHLRLHSSYRAPASKSYFKLLRFRPKSVTGDAKHMNPMPETDLPHLAHRIAAAIRLGNMERLENHLESAARAAQEQAPTPDAAERLDLLGAVAFDLRRSLRRSRCNPVAARSEWTANLGLLEHLEHSSYFKSSRISSSSLRMSAKASGGC